MIAFLAHATAACAAAFFFSSIIAGNPVIAQQPLSCNAPTLGATACLGNKQCACIYDRGGIAAGVPAGYRWDCGILRPSCGSSFDQPATLDPYTGPYPDGLSIDRSHSNVTVEQKNTSTNTNVNSDTVIQRGTPAMRAPIGEPLPLLPPE